MGRAVGLSEKTPQFGVAAGMSIRRRNSARNTLNDARGVEGTRSSMTNKRSRPKKECLANVEARRKELSHPSLHVTTSILGLLGVGLTGERPESTAVVSIAPTTTTSCKPPTALYDLPYYIYRRLQPYLFT
jgi:hypothetical protein